MYGRRFTRRSKPGTKRSTFRCGPFTASCKASRHVSVECWCETRPSGWGRSSKRLAAGCAPWVKGYRVKILDGNHLPHSERRLGVLRPLNVAPLPGHTLVVLDPAWMLAIDAFPCEDAQPQERGQLPQVLETVEPRDLWIADRAFATLRVPGRHCPAWRVLRDSSAWLLEGRTTLLAQEDGRHGNGRRFMNRLLTLVPTLPSRFAA